MKFTIGSYEVMVRRSRGVSKKKAVYCRSHEEFGVAVRAAGIDIWQTAGGFRDDCGKAGIEVDMESNVYFMQGLNILRNVELDAGKVDECDSQLHLYADPEYVARSINEDENDEAALKMLGQAHSGPGTKIIPSSHAEHLGRRAVSRGDDPGPEGRDQRQR